MTIEEKAKAYNEALKQAQYWLNAPQVIEDWSYTVKDIIPNIFPELKENEDEKIRKELLEEIEFIIPHEDETDSEGLILPSYRARIDRYKSYLEKQKEQKPAEWSEKDKDYYDAIIAKLEVTQDDAMLTDNQMDFLKSLPERLNLQPKQEWSEDYNEEKIQTRFAFYTYKDDPSVLYLSNVFVEETSRNHGFGARILKAAEKVAEAVGATTIRLKAKQNSPANAWYCKNGYRYVTFEDGYDWLEKNLEYMKPNKQEWNEKDNIMFENIILCLKEYCLTDEINWLKSLPERFNLQPKHEWRHYIWAVNLRFDYDGLVRYEDNGSYEIVTAGNKPKRQVNGEYILLKDISLADWKPSKEQIEALNEAIGDFRMEDTASCEKTAGTLESLYKDLQKLL